MTFRRTLIAAALFLIATYLNLYLPAFSQKALPEMCTWIDAQTLALPLPEEALEWLASR